MQQTTLTQYRILKVFRNSVTVFMPSLLLRVTTSCAKLCMFCFLDQFLSASAVMGLICKNVKHQLLFFCIKPFSNKNEFSGKVLSNSTIVLLHPQSHAQLMI